MQFWPWRLRQASRGVRFVGMATVPSLLAVGTPAECHALIETFGGIEYVAGAVAEGRPLRRVARDLGVPYFWLHRWVYAVPARSALYRSALRARADEDVEDAIAIADHAADGELTVAAVQAAKLRADQRWKRAERAAPEVWGAPQNRTVAEVNVNVQHLDALRRVNAAPPAIPGVDYEVLDADPGQETGTPAAQVEEGQQIRQLDNLLP